MLIGHVRDLQINLLDFFWNLGIGFFDLLTMNFQGQVFLVVHDHKGLFEVMNFQKIDLERSPSVGQNLKRKIWKIYLQVSFMTEYKYVQCWIWWVFYEMGINFIINAIKSWCVIDMWKVHYRGMIFVSWKWGAPFRKFPPFNLCRHFCSNQSVWLSPMNHLQLGGISVLGGHLKS